MLALLQYNEYEVCLNPCFSGGCSRRKPVVPRYIPVWSVLILVLVEDGLGEPPTTTSITKSTSLNPCFSGGWSRSTVPL